MVTTVILLLLGAVVLVALGYEVIKAKGWARQHRSPQDPRQAGQLPADDVQPLIKRRWFIRTLWIVGAVVALILIVWAAGSLIESRSAKATVAQPATGTYRTKTVIAPGDRRSDWETIAVPVADVGKVIVHWKPERDEDYIIWFRTHYDPPSDSIIRRRGEYIRIPGGTTHVALRAMESESLPFTFSWIRR